MKLENILSKIASNRPVRPINGPNGEPYLKRYYLFRIPILDITFYLHHFVDSDPDRGLHDHPWGWACSLILSGFYTELKAVDIERKEFSLILVSRYQWRLNFLRGDDWHRVILAEQYGKPLDCWTLFIHGPRIKGWGFMQTEAHLDNGRGLVTGYKPQTINRRWDDFKWWKKKKGERT